MLEKNKQAEKSKNGETYTKLPNEYLEAKARFRIHPLACQILSVIERKTFGWHKDWDSISRRQFREATGLSSWDVVRGIAIVECMRMVEVKRKGRGKVTAYKVQMDFSRWRNLTVSVRQLTEKNHLSSMVRQVAEKDQLVGTGATTTCRQRCDKSLDGSGATYKRKCTKEIDKEKKDTKRRKGEIPPYSLSKEKRKHLREDQTKGFALPPIIQKELQKDDE